MIEQVLPFIKPLIEFATKQLGIRLNKTNLEKESLKALAAYENLKTLPSDTGFEIDSKKGIKLFREVKEDKMEQASSELIVINAQNRLYSTEIDRQRNIEHVFWLTIQNTINQSKVGCLPDLSKTSERIDEDWLRFFFNYVKDISSDDIKFIWANILHGEVINPGSISLRTLQLLRLVSKSEAKILKKLLRTIITHVDNTTGEVSAFAFCKHHSQAQSEKDFILSHNESIIMEGCGFLSSVEFPHKVKLKPHEQREYKLSTSKKITLKSLVDRDIRYDVKMIKHAHPPLLELFNIIEEEPSEDYIDFVKDRFKCDFIEISID